MEEGLKMFSASIYDVSDEAKRKEDQWQRTSQMYVVAKTLESATAMAKKSLAEDEILVGVSEMVDARFII